MRLEKLMIQKNNSIFVTGHKGLVGSAICRKLTEQGNKKIITISKDKLDLRNQKEVFNFFKKKKNRRSYQCCRSCRRYICKQQIQS